MSSSIAVTGSARCQGGVQTSTHSGNAKWCLGVTGRTGEVGGKRQTSTNGGHSAARNPRPQDVRSARARRPFGPYRTPATADRALSELGLAAIDWTLNPDTPCPAV
jgi:hypothetical protein